MTEQATRPSVRHARMQIRSAVLMMHGSDAWSSELVDISATGVLVHRPDDWSGKPGDMFVLDMLIGEELNIHLEATVARVTSEHVGFAYARIPEDKEVPLWNLLGGFADKIERFGH